MKKISSFVPAPFFLEGKQGRSARDFREDIAVLGADGGYRILAYRAEDNSPCVGADLCDVWQISAQAQCFLESQSPTHDRVLVPITGGSVLFCNHLRATGILIALRFWIPPTAAAKWLQAMWQDTPMAVLAPDEAENRPITDAQIEQIQNICYYLARILCDRDSIGLTTRSLLIANFVGYRIDRITLPISHPPILPDDLARFTAFLFCMFLSLRTEPGTTSLGADEQESRTQTRLCLTFLSSAQPNLKDVKRKKPNSRQPRLQLTRSSRPLAQQNTTADLLSLPAFSTFSVLERQGYLRMETTLAHDNAEKLLRSGTPATCRVRIELIPVAEGLSAQTPPGGGVTETASDRVDGIVSDGVGVFVDATAEFLCT